MRDFILGDCMDYLPDFADNHFDLAIVDPPYGIGRTRMNIKGRTVVEQYKGAHFDDRQPDKKYWQELFRVSQNQIVWGGNYFVAHLAPSSGWVVWQKHMNPNATAFSAAELAWSSFDCKLQMFVRSVSRHNTDFVNGNGLAKKIHACQKPIELYKWLLSNYAEQGDLILDTHIGSASSLIACEDMGFDYVGYEIDEDYYEAAQKRLTEYRAQLKLFA